MRISGKLMQKSFILNNATSLHLQDILTDYLLHFPSINGSRLRREVAAYLINLSAICCIFPGIAHILYLLQGFLCRTITLEFEDVDIVLGLNHTIFPTFALLL